MQSFCQGKLHFLPLMKWWNQSPSSTSPEKPPESLNATLTTSVISMYQTSQSHSLFVQWSIISKYSSKYLFVYLLHGVYCLQYSDKYADYIGFPHLEEWRKELCMSALLNSIENLDTYRDSWDDDDLLQETLQNPYFTQFTSP